MSSRIQQLDSLRGVAALTVVIYHLFLMLPAFDSRTPINLTERILLFSPASIIWAGHQAVVLFFVLSGYVLSLPFYRSHIRYSSFIVKRICRIYIPYVVAIFVAFMIRTVFIHGGTLPGLSGYFNREWTTPLTRSNLVDHLIMVGRQFNTDTLDSPIWSLIHEMRISVIFPLLMVFIIRFRWQINITIGVLFTLIGMSFQLIFHATYQPIYKTLPYVLMFIVGALLAKHSETIIHRLSALKLKAKLVILVIGLLLYNTTDWVLNGHLLQLKAFDDFETLVGSAILIAMALSWKTLANLLLTRPLRFLGKISYSLYLFHAIVLFSLTYLIYQYIPLWLLWLGILGASILVSTVSYHWLEVPTMRLGRLLSNSRTIKHDGLRIHPNS